MSCLTYCPVRSGSCLGLRRPVRVSGPWPNAASTLLTGIGLCCPNTLQAVCTALTKENNKTYPDVQFSPSSHNQRCGHWRTKCSIKKTSSRGGSRTARWGARWRSCFGEQSGSSLRGSTCSYHVTTSSNSTSRYLPPEKCNRTFTQKTVHKRSELHWS